MSTPPSVRPLNFGRPGSGSSVGGGRGTTTTATALDLPLRPPARPASASPDGVDAARQSSASPLLAGLTIPRVQRPSPSSPFSDWEAYIVSQTQNWDEHRLTMHKPPLKGRVMWADQQGEEQHHPQLLSPPPQPSSHPSSIPAYVKTRQLNDPAAIATSTLEVRARKSFDSSALLSGFLPKASSPTSPTAPTSSLKINKLLSPKTKSRTTTRLSSTFVDSQFPLQSVETDSFPSRSADFGPTANTGLAASTATSIDADGRPREEVFPRFGPYLSPTSAAAAPDVGEHYGLGPPFSYHDKRLSISAASGTGSEASGSVGRAPSSNGSALSDVRVGQTRPAFLEQYGLEPNSGESEEDDSHGEEEGVHSDADPDTDVTTPRMDLISVLGAAQAGLPVTVGGERLSSPPLEAPKPSKGLVGRMPRLLVRRSKADNGPSTADAVTTATGGSTRSAGTAPSSSLFATENPFATTSNDELSTSSPQSAHASSKSPSNFWLGATTMATNNKQKAPSTTSRKSGSSPSAKGGSGGRGATTSSILRSMPIGELIPRSRKDRQGSVSSLGAAAAASAAGSATSKRSRRGYLIDSPSEPVPRIPTSADSSLIPSPRRRKMKKQQGEDLVVEEAEAQTQWEAEAEAEADEEAADAADHESIFSLSSRSSSHSEVEGQRLTTLAGPLASVSSIAAATSTSEVEMKQRTLAGVEVNDKRVASKIGPNANDGSAQSEWDDFKIKRYPRSVRVHMDVAQAVALLRKGELRELLDPGAVPSNDVPPLSDSLLTLKDNVERLYIGGGGDAGPLCDAFSRHLTSLMRWENPIVTSTAASVYALCWYRGLLLPLLFTLAALFLLTNRPAPASDADIRASTRSQHQRMDTIEAVEQSLLGGPILDFDGDFDGVRMDKLMQLPLVTKASEAVAALADLQERWQRLTKSRSKQVGQGAMTMLAVLALGSWTMSSWMVTRLCGMVVGLVVFGAALPLASRRVAGWLGAAFDGVATDAEYTRDVLKKRAAAAS